MGGLCFDVSTPPGQCVNVPGPNNDKASSATAHAGSRCTLYQHGDCKGRTLELQPLQALNKFSDYNFDKAMSAYRCNWQLPTTPCNILVTDASNGTEYGYINTQLNDKGFYGNIHHLGRVPCKCRSHTLDPRYRHRSLRLTLRAANGPSASPDSRFPFFGGIVWGNERLALYPGGYTSIPLGQTRESPPSGLPRVFTNDNSLSAATDGEPAFVESPIWRYDPTTQELTAQWINPDGDEPETTLVFEHYPYPHTPPALVLAGDVEAMKQHGDFFHDKGSYPVVKLKCVLSGGNEGVARA
ncbi:hypothetical protein R3P38DRAFT_341511 [Favolaschia claudopus]|uniref:Uncharacterized protein n=1 Tax=Favolaschia claudopus TaxID=2862362 RepID=A0AAV9ZKY5_9AGAR